MLMIHCALVQPIAHQQAIQKQYKFYSGICIIIIGTGVGVEYWSRRIRTKSGRMEFVCDKPSSLFQLM